MKRGVVVVGAGGHAKVCIELLQACGKSVDYAIGDAYGALTCVGVPVLNGDEHLGHLRGQGYSEVFIAVGSNSQRQRLAKLATGHGFMLVNAVSPNAVVSRSVTLGAGIAIMAGAVINAETVVADLVIVNTGATIDHDCRISAAAHIAPQCALAGNVEVGERVFLGVGTKVIPGIKIYSDAILGAGSVVISNINKGVMAMGVPARSSANK